MQDNTPQVRKRVCCGPWEDTHQAGVAAGSDVVVALHVGVDMVGPGHGRKMLARGHGSRNEECAGGHATRFRVRVRGCDVCTHVCM